MSKRRKPLGYTKKKAAPKKAARRRDHSSTKTGSKRNWSTIKEIIEPNKEIIEAKEVTNDSKK